MSRQSVLVTGASGVGGQEVCRQLAEKGYVVRMADIVAPPREVRSLGEFVRCDTRTPDDARAAVEGMGAVIHLAAWHCAHEPPVSDSTIFAVNVDGTYNILEAARQEGIKAIVYASSMAYGHGWVYGVTKVIGEDLCRAYHNSFDASIAMLRYHQEGRGPKTSDAVLEVTGAPPRSFREFAREHASSWTP